MMEGYIYHKEKMKYWLAYNKGMTADKSKAHLYTKEFFDRMFSADDPDMEFIEVAND